MFTGRPSYHEMSDTGHVTAVFPDVFIHVYVSGRYLKGSQDVHQGRPSLITRGGRYLKGSQDVHQGRPSLITRGGRYLKGSQDVHQGRPSLITRGGE
ncbi:hypothetical protein J6590_023518 [Homalodisca vitripennis]|nr:hypothetical protein J6590_023518 [Homalodisca vitripennis]